MSRRAYWIPRFWSGGDINECPRKLRSSALRSLGRGGSLGACENIYARYAAVSFSWSRRPSVPNHVWWNFSSKMSTYRRSHTRIMDSSSRLLWQPHYPIRAFRLLLYWTLFYFSVEERVGCHAPCGGFCWLGYSQITGGMSYRLMPGGQLMPGFTLGLHDPCSCRDGWTTGWTYLFFYLC